MSEVISRWFDEAAVKLRVIAIFVTSDTVSIDKTADQCCIRRQTCVVYIRCVKEERSFISEFSIKQWSAVSLKQRNLFLLPSNRNQYSLFRLAYLYLTLVNLKGQGQGHGH